MTFNWLNDVIVSSIKDEHLPHLGLKADLACTSNHRIVISIGIEFIFLVAGMPLAIVNGGFTRIARRHLKIQIPGELSNYRSDLPLSLLRGRIINM